LESAVSLAKEDLDRKGWLIAKKTFPGNGNSEIEFPVSVEISCGSEIKKAAGIWEVAQRGERARGLEGAVTVAESPLKSATSNA